MVAREVTATPRRATSASWNRKGCSELPPELAFLDGECLAGVPAAIAGSPGVSCTARGRQAPVHGQGTAAGRSYPAPNDIDPQGPGRSGRGAIAPGPGPDRAA